MAVEVVAEPEADPVPPTTVPAETTNAEVVDRVAVDGAPKEDVLVFPLLGNEMRMGKQIVKNVRVQNWLVLHLLAEFVATEALTVLLTFGEPESVLLGILVPLELAALLVLLNPPTVRSEWFGVEVDDMLGHRDQGVAEEDLAELTQHTAP